MFMTFSVFLKRFAVIEEFLKRKTEFFKNVQEEKDLKRYFINSNLVITAFTAVYGVAMGVYPGGWQVLNDAVKIPLLLLLSLYITLPTYYILDVLLGGKVSLNQVSVLMLSGFTVMSTVLLAFIPVNLFFILTTANTTTETYAFVVLLNVAIFGLAGLSGVAYLLTGFRAVHREPNWTLAFLVGSLVLIFVGTQLAWILRPYFHYYPGFIRPVRDNFYVAILRLIQGLSTR